MLRRLLSSLIALLLVIPGLAAAQGFNSFSGRNHPELDWRVAVTPHFRIMYPERLAGIETEAAAVAEASYAALSANLGVTFDERIRIYLSDEDEITNGFAVPIGTGYTNIWVDVTDLDIWTGREKWLRKVVAHELAHIFHFQAVKGNLGALGFFFGDPLPRFWTEGLAQYETEDWDAQRGDRWLRTAVLDDALSYSDGTSVWNGRLLYAVGNAQVRYFAETYGDSTLADLLAHRDTVLFGLGRVHDFSDAIEATIDRPYRAFYDDWRRHVNVYYNTIAGQMEPLDSLGGDRLALPGQYLYDVRRGPDTSRTAVLALTSLARPVRRLYLQDRAAETTRILADGTIHAPISWRPDGAAIAFARTTRGERGALLSDLFLVDVGNGRERRLTRSRRATAPAFAPGGRHLAFLGAERGTNNVFLLDLATGGETPLTRFEGDVQLSGLRWHPTDSLLAFARFDADGTRDVVLLDLATGALTPVTSGDVDDRVPVWSPDGTALAYTSLRDDVPNVFVRDLATGAERRVTFLAVGATAYDWLPADSLAAGALTVVANAQKTRDEARRVDAGRTAPAEPVELPEGYAAWTTHRPPVEVPPFVDPAPALVEDRYRYRPLRNLTHASTLVLPYYSTPSDWGVLGVTAWVEPLAKHLVSAAGALSVSDPLGSSFLVASYVNNTLRPSLVFSLYRVPGTTRVYGDDLLVETYTGGDATAVLPLDVRVRPYVGTTFDARLRYADVEPLDADAFDAPGGGLLRPESGQIADVRFALQRTKQRPYRDNVVHPLDGEGVRVELTGALDVLGADARYLRVDAAAYTILSGLGLHRLLLYGRAQAQTGTPLAQDYLGLARHDDVQIGLPGIVPFRLGGTERVRGYRRYALGDRLLFGTAEYRIPLLASLETELLGLVSLGATSVAAFADGALVWQGADLGDAVDRVGVGLELKNAIRLVSVLEFAHALGVAQPAAELGSGDVEVYYRIRASVPF